MDTLVFDKDLDCKGMNCPLPIYKTKQAIDAMEVGQVLKMMATDPGSVADIAAWVHQTGHKLIDQQADDGIYTYYLEKV